jgi:8-oxo-dGTP diphosphatase
MNQQVVAAAFFLKDNCVLVAKRAKTKKIAPGKYHLPGGHVEFGEEVPASLAREIREELAVDIEVGEPFHVFTYTTLEDHTVGIVFFAWMLDESQPIVLDPEDNETYLWLSLDNDAQLLESVDDHNYRAIRAGIEKLKCGTHSRKRHHEPG